MSKLDPSVLEDQELKTFLNTQKDFDLMRFDAWNKDAVSDVLSPTANDRLLRLQRLARVTDDYSIAEKLIAAGYDSAQHIALKTEQRFLADTAAQFDSQEQALNCYRRARGVKGLRRSISVPICIPQSPRRILPARR